MHVNVLPLYTHLTPVWGQKIKKQRFFEDGYVEYQIM